MQIRTVRNDKPFTVKVAMWSARHRWLVAGVWIVLMAALVVAPALIPANKNEYDPYAGLDFESAKGYSALKANGGEANPVENFYLLVSKPGQVVTDPAFKETVTGIVNELQGFTYTKDGQSGPLFSKVLNPYQVPPQYGLISADGTTVRIMATVPRESGYDAMVSKLKPYRAQLTALKSHYEGYSLLVSNRTLDYIEGNESASESLNHSLLITLIPTFLILLVVFGAFVASVVPLVLAMTAIIGANGIIGIYSRLSGETDLSTAVTLAVLMGLAVAVDYSLFVISRYRRERLHGREKLNAIEVAMGTAGRAVFFSGVLVAISISGLLIIGSVFVGMAVGMMSVVLLSVLGSMTFLPAVLSILGKGINWGRIPYFGRPREEGSGVWSKLVKFVMNNPVATVCVSLGLLIALSAPLTQIKLGFVQDSSDKLEGDRAATLMNEKWPQGTALTMQVVITGADKPETKAAIDAFEAALLQVPGLSGPVNRIPSVDGKVLLLSLYQSGSWNDEANHQTVLKLRQEIVPANFKNLDGVQVYVTGMSASAMDNVNFFMNPVVWVFVLGLSFIVLTLVFRSVVIGFKAIILNLLSTGASYGVVVLVFQYGWLGVKPTGVLEAWLPVFIFTIIFGLSMDYHMFILTRIKEFLDRGHDTNEAVEKGISVTSGTITGAAAIMVVVFGDFFVGLDISAIRQVGLGLAVAVLLDATVVRSMLLPAAMRLLGKYNWYFPAFLNWIPVIRIESEPAEEKAPALEPQDEMVPAA